VSARSGAPSWGAGARLALIAEWRRLNIDRGAPAGDHVAESALGDCARVHLQDSPGSAS
jgi:hypothetical protein